MFITMKRSGYNRHDEQTATGLFLILMQPDMPGLEGCKQPIRAIVRHVSMRQLGHWMMGAARVHGKRIGVSGSYGADGLPKTVDPDTYARGMILPDELREAWKKGGGWNGAGNEAPAMRAWAIANLKALRA